MVDGSSIAIGADIQEVSAEAVSYGGRRLIVGQNQTTKLIFLNFNKFRVEYSTIIIAPNIIPKYRL